jgi:methionyl-tRNA synthetase
VREETFVTETEATASDFKDPVSGKPLEKMLESSYFFKQSKCALAPVRLRRSSARARA